MTKFAMILTASVLVLGAMTATGGAQTQWMGASRLQAQLKNATPIVKEVACNGRTGHCGCGAGWISACGNRCCHCVPCQ
jgi:hypothetical protein